MRAKRDLQRLRAILVLILVCLVSLPAQAKYAGGSGTAQDPYQIATAVDLILLGESSGDYDKHFILMADIDLDPKLPGGKLFDTAVNRLYQTWLAGWANGTNSWVGNTDPPFVEQVVVHGGNQSLPMDYDNTAEPWYSEAQRTWETPQDWTTNDADTLTLYFQGQVDNSPERLYVAIEDSAGQIAVVAHPDPNAVLVTQWQKWHVPLADLRAAGVDVAAVKKMAIGVGDRNDPKPGGTGKIYIDDIRLTKRMP